MHGYGTAQKGMAGAGAALLFGPSDAATNPAAGVFSGPGLDFGVAAFSPDRQFEVTGTPSGLSRHVRPEAGRGRRATALVPRPALRGHAGICSAVRPPGGSRCTATAA